MIGAIVLKLMAGSGMKEWNRRDISKILSHFTDDAIYIYPGNMPVSGMRKGKKALEEFFNRYLEQFPELDFKIKTTCVKNIFDPCFCNTVAIEFESSYTNKHGEFFQNSGVSVFKVKWGKVTHMQDYYFDVEKLQQAWRP
jgi:ketosteroid isomerase-like protein